jgi:ribonuclease P protein component
MLTKHQRIAKKKDFDYIFTNGKSRYSNVIGVKFVVNGLTFNRFGLIISNKVSKSAVDRNRIRRRLYTQITTLLPILKIGYDVIVIIQPAAKNFTSPEFHKYLADLFKSAKITNGI